MYETCKSDCNCDKCKTEIEYRKQLEEDEEDRTFSSGTKVEFTIEQIRWLIDNFGKS